MASSDRSTELVTLDVGGTLFRTRRVTLTRLPGSTLAAMFADSAPTGLCDDDGRPFIDRNPKHFGTILDFLRDGFVSLPDSRVDLEELRREGEYYGLEELLAILDEAEERCKQQQASQDARQAAADYLAIGRATIAQEADQKLAAATAAQAEAAQQLAVLEPQMARESQDLQDQMQRVMDASLAPADRQDAKAAVRSGKQRLKILQAELDEAGSCVEAAWQEGAEGRALKLAALGIALPPPQPKQQQQQQQGVQQRQQSQSHEAGQQQPVQQQRQASQQEEVAVTSRPRSVLLEF